MRIRIAQQLRSVSSILNLRNVTEKVLESGESVNIYLSNKAEVFLLEQQKFLMIHVLRIKAKEVSVEEGKVNNPQTSDNERVSDDKSHVEKTSKFIEETSLDKMLEIAELARMKKLTEPPKWVYPEDI